MSKRPVLLGAFWRSSLGACATLPSGPSVMVLPGAQKTFEQFREDDALCQFYARQAVGGQTPTQTAMDSGTASAVTGTAIGAAAGALIGAAAGEPAGGAAIGAGSGLLLGSAAGPGATRALPMPCRTATTSPTCNACTPRGTRCPSPQHIGMHFRAISPRRRYRTAVPRRRLLQLAQSHRFPHPAHSRRPTIGETDFDAVGYRALDRPAPGRYGPRGRRPVHGLRPYSMERVTSAPTSSADRPGASVWITIRGGTNSGKTSSLARPAM